MGGARKSPEAQAGRGSLPRRAAGAGKRRRSHETGSSFFGRGTFAGKASLGPPDLPLGRPYAPKAGSGSPAPPLGPPPRNSQLQRAGARRDRVWRKLKNRTSRAGLHGGLDVE